jgi:hypothetical protein
MDEMTGERFESRLVMYGMLAGVILLLPKTVMGNDIGIFILSFLIGIIVSLIMLVLVFLRVRRQPLATLSMLVTFVGVSFLLFKVSDVVRTTGRWIFHSSKYKAEVLGQPESHGELKHVEWDGWGFAGSGDTTVYLVFDPNDALAAAKRNSPGKYSGIPCEVPEVHRLEKHWYTVMFYTNTNWAYCGGDG